MKYFIDTEFHEYHKQHKCFGVKTGKPVPTIDLISIGIISENGKKYYAVSKDFNIKDAWNSYQIEMLSGDMRNRYPNGIKVYWLRENILKQIFIELAIKYYNYLHFTNSKAINTDISSINGNGLITFDIIEKHLFKFNLKNFKKLINKYGKTNKQIAYDIIKFTWKKVLSENPLQIENHHMPIEFYAYYADYDWVVFAQLFGKMIDLPKNFPMYCIDLKQELDYKIDKKNLYYLKDILNIKEIKTDRPATFEEKLKFFKESKYYPKQYNEHNALDDARWNKKLKNFIDNDL